MWRGGDSPPNIYCESRVQRGGVADGDGGRDVDGDASQEETAEVADGAWYMKAVKAGGALSFAMGHPVWLWVLLL